jgi:hypothetical protein
MERSPRPQDITWFLDLNRLKQLNLDPPYQRKSVWTRGDKQFFLDTIFHNFPCPAVFLHKAMSDNGDTVYHVVDGKQRITTILEFVQDLISIPKDFGDNRLAGKKWSQLDSDSKKMFWNYLITVEMMPAVDDILVNNVFERINRNSRKLADQERRHAKFDGWLITRAEAEANKQEWKDFGIVTTARAKRMADVQFISELMMLTLKRQITGFDQDALDQFYADYDVPAETVPTFNEEDFNTAFEGIKRFLTQMNEANGSVGQYGRTLAHFYTLWGYAVLSRPDNADAAQIASRYADFMARVAEVLNEHSVLTVPDDTLQYRNLMDYMANVRGATTDATPRLVRHRALSSALENAE